MLSHMANVSSERCTTVVSKERMKSNQSTWQPRMGGSPWPPLLGSRHHRFFRTFCVGRPTRLARKLKPASKPLIPCYSSKGGHRGPPVQGCHGVRLLSFSLTRSTRRGGLGNGSPGLKRPG
jgi:hypothetical protein